jgi:hypothetical protein
VLIQIIMFHADLLGALPSDTVNAPDTGTPVVFGANQRGPVVWKIRDGAHTYRDRQTERLRQAGVKIAKG